MRAALEIIATRIIIALVVYGVLLGLLSIASA